MRTLHNTPLFCTILLVLCPIVFTSAQPSYKDLQRRLPELSDREALYQLSDYQAWYPQKPHPYYLMANIYCRLLQEEHPIVDYNEKQRMLYTANLYYGNCRAFIKNDQIKADLYPLAANNGKLTEEELRTWLSLKMDTLKRLMADLDNLNNAYSLLVNRYDSCMTLFNEFSTRYLRLKNAQMMLDSIDFNNLYLLRDISQYLQGDVENYQKALVKSPIKGYNPTFHSKEISLYRLDGIIATNFLQNDIYMWDYLTWVNNFLNQQEGVNSLKQDINAEHNKLQLALQQQQGKPIMQDKRLLNRINKYDEDSPMAQFLQLEYVSVSSANIKMRILDEMQKEEADWLIRLQLFARLQDANREAETITEKLRNSDVQNILIGKYTSFMQTHFAQDKDFDTYLSALSEQRNNNSREAKETLTAAADEEPRTLQINADTQATISKEDIQINNIQQQANQ